MLPFIYADTRMVPAGIRAIGSALVDTGFEKTRIVLQQWNRKFRPSRMRLDGRIPDLFMVSSMGMHEASCRQLIRDAWKIDPASRPLIIVGGSYGVYESFKAFSTDVEQPASPDVVVTGEEYVFLSLLETLLTARAGDESMRTAFARARDSGALDDVPGLLYAHNGRDGVAEELVDTGIQRLVGDLDELPHPVLGYQLLEPPSRRATLGPHALPASRVRKLSPISSLVLTFGCRFACPYCPIPAYNQRQFRTKSPDRIVDEMHRLNRAYGYRYFFGTDDNFFNNTRRALDIIEILARAEPGGSPLGRRVRWGTEATIHDTLKMTDHLDLAHQAGLRALWIGVEDLTATLVNKAQSVDNTTDVFRRLRAAGIAPMPMMMHHDGQPLYSRGSDYGLLNQLRLLKRAGAVSVQVLMIVPSPGSKLFRETFTSGAVIDRAGGRKVEPYMHDGNYIIASNHKRPWTKQLNLMAAYLYFYNVGSLLRELLRPRTKIGDKPAAMQLVGILGLTHNIYRTFGWACRLAFGKIQRVLEPPDSPIPMRSVTGGKADHELKVVTLTVERPVEQASERRFARS